jgi:hypothetical protein
MTLQPADLEALFRPGVRYRLPHPDGADAEAVVELREAGSLHLATGRLVACDPFWAPDSLAPFRAAVAPGRYPVTLSIARVDRPTDPAVPSPVLSVAAAKLTVVDQPVAGWEFALRADEDPATLPPAGLPGFRVDNSGAGALVDASALAELGRRSQLGPDGQDPELDRVVPALPARQVINLVLDQNADLNVVMFLCAMGAGTYPVWVGRTAAGEPACFIADLELLTRHSPGPIG